MSLISQIINETITLALQFEIDKTIVQHIFGIKSGSNYPFQRRIRIRRRNEKNRLAPTVTLFQDIFYDKYSSDVLYALQQI